MRSDSRLATPAVMQVRMDSQVVFESCWRRFEEKYRLKVGFLQS